MKDDHAKQSVRLITLFLFALVVLPSIFAIREIRLESIASQPVVRGSGLEESSPISTNPVKTSYFRDSKPSLWVGIMAASAPTPPINLAAMSGKKLVSLTWSYPVSDGGSPVTGYYVFKGTYSNEEINLAMIGAQTWYNDTAVSDATTYYYKVKAINTIGVSGFSNEVSATTSPSQLESCGSVTINRFEPPFMVSFSITKDVHFSVGGFAGVETGLASACLKIQNYQLQLFSFNASITTSTSLDIVASADVPYDNTRDPKSLTAPLNVGSFSIGPLPFVVTLTPVLIINSTVNGQLHLNLTQGARFSLQSHYTNTNGWLLTKSINCTNGGSTGVLCFQASPALRLSGSLRAAVGFQIELSAVGFARLDVTPNLYLEADVNTSTSPCLPASVGANSQWYAICAGIGLIVAGHLGFLGVEFINQAWQFNLYSILLAKGTAATVTIVNGSFSVDNTQSTGIKVSLSSSSPPTGYATVLTTAFISKPSFRPRLNVQSLGFYDVRISGLSDGVALICIRNPNISSPTDMYILPENWTSWGSVGIRSVSANSMCGELGVGLLNGTLIALGNPYPHSIGPFLALLAAPIVGFAAIRVKKKGRIPRIGEERPDRGSILADCV